MHSASTHTHTHKTKKLTIQNHAIYSCVGLPYNFAFFSEHFSAGQHLLGLFSGPGSKKKETNNHQPTEPGRSSHHLHTRSPSPVIIIIRSIGNGSSIAPLHFCSSM